MFNDLYKAIYALLAADATFTALCSTANIRSSLDPLAPATGNVFTYAIDGASYNPKTKRGGASLKVFANSNVNKATSHLMMNRFFQVVTARTLASVAGVSTVCSLFRESEGARTDSTEEDGYWQVETSVDMKVVQI